MTVTKRRVKADTGVEGSAATEPGIKYTCDSCSIDITHTVRIKCAAPGCEEVDLCPNCFSEGQELGSHKAWHDYRVVETHSRPIFAEDWGADEELLLISGLQTYGLGNWAEVADYVGTRLKEDCERHYTETYLVERNTARKDHHHHHHPPSHPHSNESTNKTNGIHLDPSSSSLSVSIESDPFTDHLGEKAHPGLCTSADRIRSMGGIGGFGKVAKSGVNSKKRRQGWWGGLGVGEGWNCPMPRMKARFEISQEEFQGRKKRRIEEMRKPAPLPAAAIETKASAPQNHEVAGFMPGRLEFDHEVENEAEVVIKDMDFGLVYDFGGDEMAEGSVPAGGRDGIGNEEEDGERPKQQSTKTVGGSSSAGKSGGKGASSKKPTAPGADDGEGEEDVKPDIMDVDEDDEEDKPLAQVVEESEREGKLKRKDSENNKDKEDDDEEKVPPPNLEMEDPEDMNLKLTVLEIYYDRLSIRQQVKDFIFDRGLMDYKRLTAIEKKRGKEESSLINRYKVFAKVQTAEDFEVFVDGLIYEQTLRKRIAELQDYRRNGITTISDAMRFDKLKYDRANGFRATHQSPAPREPITSSDAILQRKGYGQEKVPKMTYPGPPSHFLYADDVSLLSPEEKSLCCDLQILPRPYLLIKDTIVRECARRGGEFDRDDAGRLFEIPEEIGAAVYDYLRSSGVLIEA